MADSSKTSHPGNGMYDCLPPSGLRNQRNVAQRMFCSPSVRAPSKTAPSISAPRMSAPRRSASKNRAFLHVARFRTVCHMRALARSAPTRIAPRKLDPDRSHPRRLAPVRFTLSRFFPRRSALSSVAPTRQYDRMICSWVSAGGKFVDELLGLIRIDSFPCFIHSFLVAGSSWSLPVMQCLLNLLYTPQDGQLLWVLDRGVLLRQHDPVPDLFESAVDLVQLNGHIREIGLRLRRRVVLVGLLHRVHGRFDEPLAISLQDAQTLAVSLSRHSVPPESFLESVFHFLAEFHVFAQRVVGAVIQPDRRRVRTVDGRIQPYFVSEFAGNQIEATVWPKRLAGTCPRHLPRRE